MTRSSQATRRLGEWGEQAAVAYLHQLGWDVVDRNWRCAIGEIDLVATPDPSTVVFVEVKCRSGLGFGDPLEAITRAKVAKLRELSSLWLRSHDLRPTSIRVDGIGVLRLPGREVEITHVRGVTS